MNADEHIADTIPIFSAQAGTLAAPSVTETRQEFLLRTGAATPRFLQGVFPFAGRGLFEARPLDEDALRYTIPKGREARLVYFRAGCHADDLVYLIILAGGRPVRFFPIGPKSDLHVPLAIVEPHAAGMVLEVGFAAERGVVGTLIVDVGILETEAGIR